MDKSKHSLSSRIAKIIEMEGVLAKTSDGAECKTIPFSRYMALCLYDEHGGYYRSGSIRTGREGDFYTSGAIGGIMGRMLARFIIGAASANEGLCYVADWGSGEGAMTAQMLEAWADHNPLWLQSIDYGVVDDHPLHLEAARHRVEAFRQGEKIAALRSLSFYSSEEAAEALRRAAGSSHIIIAANELIDAMPIHRVVMRGGELIELGVYSIEAEEGEIGFGWAYMPLSTKALADSVAADGITMREGQETEVNLAAEQWLEHIGGIVQSGMLLLVDYGHAAEEYRASHRMQGTLMCYKQHVAHANPFHSPGEQDITAHVNFTALKRAAERTGWTVAVETTQLQFLIDQGVLDLLRSHQDRDPFSETAKRNRAIRQLLLSDGMSETFKVLVLTKGEYQIQRIQKQPESV
jgi:SAM-dependent MidA family methyltransferase